MKHFRLAGLLLACLLVVASYGQSVNLKVVAQGKQIGTGTFYMAAGKDGRITTRLALNMTGPDGEKASIKIESITAKDGRPILVTHSQSFGGMDAIIKQSYGKDKVTVTETVAKKTKTTSIPIGNRDLRDASALWFVTTIPKVGTTVTAWDLSPESNKFEKSTDKYLGKKNITYGSKKVSAHHIKSDQGDFYVDDKGLLYKMTQKGLPFEIIRA